MWHILGEGMQGKPRTPNLVIFHYLEDKGSHRTPGTAPDARDLTQIMAAN